MQRLHNDAIATVRRCLPTGTLILSCIALGAVLPAAGAEPDKEALIRDALSAAPPVVAATAKVVTMDNKVLKQGSGPYTCFPTPSDVLAERGTRADVPRQG